MVPSDVSLTQLSRRAAAAGKDLVYTTYRPPFVLLHGLPSLNGHTDNISLTMFGAVPNHRSVVAAVDGALGRIVARTNSGLHSAASQSSIAGSNAPEVRAWADRASSGLVLHETLGATDGLGHPVGSPEDGGRIRLGGAGYVARLPARKSTMWADVDDLLPPQDIYHPRGIVSSPCSSMGTVLAELRSSSQGNSSARRAARSNGSAHVDSRVGTSFVGSFGTTFGGVTIGTTFGTGQYHGWGSQWPRLWDAIARPTASKDRGRSSSGFKQSTGTWHRLEPTPLDEGEVEGEGEHGSEGEGTEGEGKAEVGKEEWQNQHTIVMLNSEDGKPVVLGSASHSQHSLMVNYARVLQCIVAFILLHVTMCSLFMCCTFFIASRGRNRNAGGGPVVVNAGNQAHTSQHAKGASTGAFMHT